MIALRSTFNVGVDLFDVTDDGTERDGTFFSWLGQAQYVMRLGDSDAQMILRGTAQMASDPLPSLEQFSIGGMNTVRGYRENQLVRDMGYLASLELRIPIPIWNERRKALTLAPFVDFGTGWNHEIGGELDSFTDRDSIVSTGLGLIAQPTDWLRAELYWGHAFTDFDSAEQSHQDGGFHFRLTLASF